MCGISGIINKKGTFVENDLLLRINNLIAHRGPDDEGFFYEKNFGFGHRRLSILDLSKNGHQPMSYKKRYTITYNGEVYNYIEIKEELIKLGYEFKSNTDTEVILASYDKWGEDCVNKFNGMWAFAIFDKLKEKIFCSRDRFGIKPFYFSNLENYFVFGSEIKQLLEFFKQNEVNKSILLDYILYGLEDHTKETFFKSIFKLGQSHNLIYDLKTNTYQTYQYYNLRTKNIRRNSEEESINNLEENLYNAVRLRLRSDVKVGTCLSGGLDSSTIAAIASKEYQKTSKQSFTAIHAKSIEEKTDESQFAREVAKHCELNLIEIEPSLSDFNDIIDEVIYTQEEPFGSPSIFMQYFVMKEAKNNHCTVLLDGQGADETLFGYESYYSFYFSSLLSNFKIIKYVSEFKNMKTFKVSKKKIFIASFINIFRNFLSFTEQLIRMKNTIVKVKHDRKRLNDIFSYQNFKKFQKRELMIRSLPHLLKYEDKNSMRNSIETRLPFVDYKFVESAISTNDDLKFKMGYLKYILRLVSDKILPKSVVWRTNKFGFEAPTNLWLKKEKNKMMKTILDSKIIQQTTSLISLSKINNQLLWRLYNIAVWEKVFNVKL